MPVFRDYIEYSEKFLDEARIKDQDWSAKPYIIGSILFSWIAMESFINNRMADFAALPEGYLSEHEKGFLQEKQVKLQIAGKNAGKFIVSNQDSYVKIEEKLLFLISKCGKSLSVPIKTSNIWTPLKQIKKIRDSLTHPRVGSDSEISIDDAEKALWVSKRIIEILSLELWNEQIKW
jgi:hypothetical protein